MALTKVSRGLLNTSIVDNGNATAITIDSSENVSFTGAATFSGTVTADGLTIDGGGSLTFSELTSKITGPLNQDFIIQQRGNADTEALRIQNVDNNNLAKFDKNGDISFYNTAGTTAKLFWDASAESLTVPDMTIGSSDATSKRLIFQGNGGVGYEGGINWQRDTAVDNSITVDSSESLSINFAQSDLVSRALLFKSGSAFTERARLTSDGNLGIGTGSPRTLVNASSATGAILTLESSDISLTTNGVIGGIDFYSNDSSTNGAGAKVNIRAIAQNSSGTATALTFGTSSSGSATAVEAFRVDASGNLLVGTTSNSVYNDVSGTGIALNAGQIQIAGTGAPLYINRQGSNGVVVDFRRDGALVGSIGAEGGTVYISAPLAGGLKFSYLSSTKAVIFPVTTTGANADNLHDLGYSVNRFDNIWATNGTIQTSDRNEKQDIEELSSAETAVAVACKRLLRKFRWIDAVEKKGDDARIHFGIIAQDLQAAFAAEGLDAGRYAMFTSNTWWETQTEVEAVEAVEFVQAVEAVYDEDGELVSEAVEGVEAVEAKDAYTRTDTFQTLADAPEGATERTRLGVRYPELLAFIIAAI